MTKEARMYKGFLINWCHYGFVCSPYNRSSVLGLLTHMCVSIHQALPKGPLPGTASWGAKFSGLLLPDLHFTCWCPLAQLQSWFTLKLMKHRGSHPCRCPSETRELLGIAVVFLIVLFQVRNQAAIRNHFHVSISYEEPKEISERELNLFVSL